MTVETSSIQTGVCPWMRPLHTYWYVYALISLPVSITTVFFQQTEVSHYTASFVVHNGWEILGICISDRVNWGIDTFFCWQSL